MWSAIYGIALTIDLVMIVVHVVTMYIVHGRHHYKIRQDNWPVSSKVIAFSANINCMDAISNFNRDTRESL